VWKRHPARNPTNAGEARSETNEATIIPLEILEDDNTWCAFAVARTFAVKDRAATAAFAMKPTRKSWRGEEKKAAETWTAQRTKRGRLTMMRERQLLVAGQLACNHGRVRDETDEEKLERGREEGRRNMDSTANQKRKIDDDERAATAGRRAARM
jgi:hypothetical protein